MSQLASSKVRVPFLTILARTPPQALSNPFLLCISTYQEAKPNFQWGQYTIKGLNLISIQVKPNF